MQIATKMHETLTLDYLENTSDDTLLERLHEITEGLMLQTYNLSEQLTFRARIGDFDQITDLLNPPSELVSDYGRLNRKNESRYYCADRIEAAILEIRPKEGDIISVLEADFKDLHVLGVGMDMHSLTGSHPNNFMHALVIRSDLYKSAITHEELLRCDMANAFFHRLITAPSNVLGYRITGVLAQNFFRHEEYVGVTYPSSVSTALAMRFGSANYALKPDFVSDSAQYRRIHKYRVVERASSFTRLKPLITMEL